MTSGEPQRSHFSSVGFSIRLMFSMCFSAYLRSFCESLVELGQRVSPRSPCLLRSRPALLPGGRCTATSKMSRKFSTSRSVTTRPISVGENLPPSFCTYCRSWMVLRMAAVGRRPADAALFQFLHQRSFVVARRRLGEMLLRLQFPQRELLSRLERRQLVLELLVFLVLAILRLLRRLSGSRRT